MCTIVSLVSKKPSVPGARRKRPPQRRPVSDEAVLAYLAACLSEHGRPPTLREIGTEFGLASTNGVRYYLDRLEQAGKIRRDRWTSRGIELQAIEGRSPESAPRTAPGRGREDVPGPRPQIVGRSAGSAKGRATERDYLEIPLIGRVAAGAPILAEQHVEDTFVIDGSMARGGKHFALRVRGDSMKNAGIFDGDVVIVRHDAAVRSGDIAVVVIGEEATVKRYFPRKDKLLLFPENEDYEPIEVKPSDPDVRVAGKVVGVFRRLDS
jgi:repressor LexA